MLFPDAYVWFVLLSTLDVCLTAIVLGLGGHEVNPLAQMILAEAGIAGMVVYKFLLVVLVIVICEVVGRRRPLTGRWLAHVAVAVSALPVVLAFAQLLIRVYGS
jgi:hypothetical protein